MPKARIERTIQLLKDAGIKAYPGGAVSTDASGNATAPPDPEFVVVDLITNTPTRSSMCTTDVTTVLQLTCFAASTGDPYDLLQYVRDTLPFPEYDPGITGSNGRLPLKARTLHAVFQRFAIQLSPADNPVSS